MDNNIKDYKEKELKYYAIGNALLLIVFSGYFDKVFSILNTDSSFELSDIIATIFSSGVLSSIFYVYVFIFDSVVPGRIKDKICCLWRSLPGEIIFDKIKNGKVNDIRISKNEALNKYKKIYADLGKNKGKERRIVSNSHWYKIYRKYEKEPRIYYSHREYLLLRDLFVSTLWMVLIYLALMCMSLLDFSWIVVWGLVLELILTNIAAIWHQKEFAINVIATDISSE